MSEPFNLVPFNLSVPKEISKIDDEELGKLGFTDKAKQEFKNFAYESNFWTGIANGITPPEIVEVRDGAYDRDTDSFIQLEYFPEEYTLSELNRLFPGWWTENMLRSSADEVVKLETILVEGNLMIPYITPQGIKVRRLWAIAGSAVIFKKGTKTPVDIANGFKGARTEWIRIQGKWLGIGLDIYHQHILPGLRSLFEDRIRAWSPYAGHWKNVASKCKAGKEFRVMLKTMPSTIQVKRVLDTIPYIPETKHTEVFTSLGKLSNATEESKNQFEKWLVTLEQIAEKNKAKKEGNNGNSEI